MPDDVETKLDPKTLSEAVNFAQEHYSTHKRLPTQEEFARKFPSANITPELISGHLDVSKIETGHAAEALSQENQTEEKTDEKTEPYRRNKYLNLNQRQSTEQSEDYKTSEIYQKQAEKLKADLEPQIASEVEKALRSEKDIRRLGDQAVKDLSKEIAKASAEEIADNMGKAQSAGQSSRLIAEAVQSSIKSQTLLQSTSEKKLDKLTKKIYPAAANIAKSNSQELEKTIVLGSVANVLAIKKAGYLTPEVIEEVDRNVIAQHPLATDEERFGARANVSNFLKTYVSTYEADVVAPILSGKYISVADHQKGQSKAFDKAINTFTGKTNWKSRNLNPQALASRLGGVLGLKPLSLEQIELLGLGNAAPKTMTFAKAAGFAGSGVGLSINSKKGELESYFALLTHDKDRFQKELRNAEASFKKLQKIRSLSLSQQKELAITRNKLSLLQRAYSFDRNQGRRATTYRRMWQVVRPNNPNVAGSGLTFASGQAWDVYNSILNNKFGAVSSQMLTSPNLAGMLAERAHGSLAFSLGDFIPSKPHFGMGISVAAKGNIMAMGLDVAARVGRKIVGAYLGLLMGMGMYFFALGKAALTGFIIGASIGAGVGIGIGVAVALPFGPFAPAVMLITVPVGGVVGAAVFGLAGGLIAAGLFANSTTMVTTGVGAGIGGTVGAGVGAATGATIGGALLTPIGLTPVGALIGGMIGASVGAVVGAAVGGAIGYAIGQYVIPTIGAAATAGLGTGLLTFLISANPYLAVASFAIGYLAGGGWGQIKSFISSAAGVSTGAAGGILGTISSIAGTIWGGITGIAGSALGGFAGAVSFAIGGIGSLSLGFGAVAIPTLGGIGVLTVGATAVGIFGATSFFNAEGEQQEDQVISENENLLVKKLVTAIEKNLGPQSSLSIENTDLPQTLKFDLELDAKKDLSNIVCADTATLAKKSGGTENISTPPIPCPQTLLASDSPFKFSFNVTATKPRFEDSLLTNNFSVQATVSDNSGQPKQTSLGTTATISIGQAAESCFTFDGPWNEQERAAENEAINYISRSPTFINKVCAGGTVILNRVASSDFNFVTCSPNTINISNRGIGNTVFMAYVLAHEAGHILQCLGDGTYFNDFLNEEPFNEGYICSYPLDYTVPEDYAEMIGIYVSWQEFISNKCGKINYPSQYPEHYNFVKEKLFGNFEFF